MLTHKNSLIILLSLILFAPLVKFENIFDGHIWGPRYFVIAIGSVLLMIISLKIILRRNTKLEFHYSKIELILLLFFLYSSASLFATPFSNWNMGMFYLLLIAIIQLFTLKRIIEDNSARCGRYIAICAIYLIGFIEALMGFLQYFDFIDRPFLSSIIGSFNNSGLYANYLVIIFVFSLGILVQSDFRIPKWIRLTGLLLCLLIGFLIPITNARTAWLAAIMGVLFIAWPMIAKSRFYRSITRNKVVLLFVSITLLLITITSLIWLYQYKQESSNGRMLIYEVSLTIIKDKPVFGHGLGRFSAVYNKYQASFFTQHPNSSFAILAGNTRTAFNEILQTSVELGLVGTIFFIAIIYWIFRSKPSSRESIFFMPAKAALISIIICSLFSYPFQSLSIVILIVFILAFFLASSETRSYKVTISSVVTKPLPILLCIFVFVMCVKEWKNYKARIDWRRAVSHKTKRDWGSTLKYYRKANETLYNDGYFLYNYGIELTQFNAEEGVKILEKCSKFIFDDELCVELGNGYAQLKNYTKAEEYYIIAGQMVPHKFTPRYKLFKLYIETNQINKAKKIAKYISEMKIKIPSSTITSILNEVKVYSEMKDS